LTTVERWFDRMPLEHVVAHEARHHVLVARSCCPRAFGRLLTGLVLPGEHALGKR